jgi:hypothetical protein
MKRLPAIFALCALCVVGLVEMGQDRTPTTPIFAQDATPAPQASRSPEASPTPESDVTMAP